MAGLTKEQAAAAGAVAALGGAALLFFNPRIREAARQATGKALEEAKETAVIAAEGLYQDAKERALDGVETVVNKVGPVVSEFAGVIEGELKAQPFRQLVEDVFGMARRKSSKPQAQRVKIIVDADK